MVVKFYASNIESENAIVDQAFEKGYPSFGVEASYLYVKEHPDFAKRLKKWQVNQHVRVYIESGLKVTNESNNKRNDKVRESIDLMGVDNFEVEYTNWLVENKDLVECAYEVYADWISQQTIESFREDYVKKGLANRIILIFNPDIPVQTYAAYLEQGINWIAIPPIEENYDTANTIESFKKMGFNVHLISFDRYDKFKDVSPLVESVSTTAWTYGSRANKMFIHSQGLKVRDVAVDSVNAILGNVFWNVFPDSVRNKVKALKGNHYINAWNIFQLQEYITESINRYIPQYKQYIEEGNPLPDFVKEGKTDITRSALFRPVVNGMNSKRLSEISLRCNDCIIRDKCYAYQKDAVCAFTKMWKDIGVVSTRNTEFIIKKMEDIVSDQYSRLLRAQFFEDVQGGKLTKNVTDLQNDLIRNLDIMFRLKFGTGGANKFQILNIGNNQTVVGGADEALNQLRSELGDQVADKIKKRLDKGEVLDGDRDIGS
jgi:hypothetical protein